MSTTMTSPSNNPNPIGIGSPVKIVNLVSAAQYNNKIGIVESFSNDTGRYSVKLKTNASKSLGVKPSNLLLVCFHCQTKVITDENRVKCNRCDDVLYCSEKCRSKHWVEHKAACIPTDLPEAPQCVPDCDRGDESFEAAERYLELAEAAGKDGRFAEQIQLCYNMIEKRHKQPSTYFQLFMADKATDQFDKAFDNLVHTVQLLMDPRLQPGSDPTSVLSLPATNEDNKSIGAFIGIVIGFGVKFIEEHRVIGRSGNELEHERNLLMAFVQLGQILEDEGENVVSMSDFSPYERSDLFECLGNVYRKMQEDPDLIIKTLQVADRMVEPLGEHNYPALMLINEMQFNKIMTIQDPLLILEKAQEVVDEARNIRDMCADRDTGNPNAVYCTEILLSTMLHNYCMLLKRQGRESELEMRKEVYELAASGYETACQLQDQREMMRAKRILDVFVTA